MKSIYKYTLTVGKITVEGNIVKILSAKEQYNRLCMWAEVRDDAPKAKYTFLTVGTGWDIEDFLTDGDKLSQYKFLDTVLFEEGSLVFHVFYKKELE